MLDKLYEKLKNSHKEVFVCIRDGRLYDAFVLVKEQEDYGSKLLTCVIYILLGKNRDGYQKLKDLEKDEGFKKSKIIEEDIFYEMIGTCCFSMKNYLDAAGYYIKALEINKENFFSQYNLASINILNKNYRKALEILEKLEKITPDDEIIKKNIENLKAKLK